MTGCGYCEANTAMIILPCSQCGRRASIVCLRCGSYLLQRAEEPFYAMLIRYGLLVAQTLIAGEGKISSSLGRAARKAGE